MNRFLMIGLSLSLATLTACYHLPTESTDTSTNLSKLEQLENQFWKSLSTHCGHRFSGTSSFPSDPEDSFYGKTLTATIADCSDTEIRVPFDVGENKTRTWIFTKTANGLQLKHQHLHADGTLDEVSNYGGLASDGESALVQATSSTEIGTVSLAFPADEFTQKLLPAASTNVWNITLTNKPEESYTAITYYLTRHDKPRFKANLTHEK